MSLGRSGLLTRRQRARFLEFSPCRSEWFAAAQPAGEITMSKLFDTIGTGALILVFGLVAPLMTVAMFTGMA